MSQAAWSGRLVWEEGSEAFPCKAFEASNLFWVVWPVVVASVELGRSGSDRKNDRAVGPDRVVDAIRCQLSVEPESVLRDVVPGAQHASVVLVRLAILTPFFIVVDVGPSRREVTPGMLAPPDEEFGRVAL